MSASGSRFARVLRRLSGSKTTLGSTKRARPTNESRSAGRRRVRFADRPVAEVRTRPPTPRGDAGRLFYTDSEIERFRRAAEVEDVVAAALRLAGVRLAHSGSKDSSPQGPDLFSEYGVVF